MPKVPDHIELHLSKKFEEERKSNDGLFSHKWVEKALSWFLYAVCGAVVVGLVTAAFRYFLS
jgi:hypothetical protein